MSDPPTSVDLADIERRPVLEDITILIPTLGRSILQKSLSCIANGSEWPAEVLVVDQGQTPEVANWLKQLQIFGITSRHVPSDQRGRSSGLNRGLETVRTRFVAITDDDCFVDSEWLRNMHTHLMRNPGSIVTGRVDADGDGAIIVVSSRMPVVYRRPRLKFDSLSGGNMGTSMEVVRNVGPFDEDPRLATCEDGEWAYRALRRGVPIVYAPDVAVLHYGWRNERERAAQYRNYARSHGGFYGKYIRRGDAFILLRASYHHVRAFVRCLRGSLAGNDERVLSGWAYLTGLLPGILAGLKKDRDA
jgi:GT2 family glycosyltransferase